LFAGATAAMAIPNVWGREEILPPGASTALPGDLIYRPDGDIFAADFDEYTRTRSLVVPRMYVYGTLTRSVYNSYPEAERFLIVRNPVVPFWRRR